MSANTGQRLLRFDRSLGVRFVAGADEAGRGSLAGPLVVAGVLFDYAALRGHRTRPLALLNDSKQVDEELREALLQAVLDAATHVSVRIIPACDIDRHGLHRSNLWGLRTVLADLSPRAELCLVDGFRGGSARPIDLTVCGAGVRQTAKCEGEGFLSTGDANPPRDRRVPVWASDRGGRFSFGLWSARVQRSSLATAPDSQSNGQGYVLWHRHCEVRLSAVESVIPLLTLNGVPDGS